jgi:hypothetical protein
MEARHIYQRQTVNNDITRCPIDRQRWRIGGLGWEECVGFIVGVPRTETSIKRERMKEKKVQVEVFEQGLQFLGGGHRLRLSV